MNCILRLSSMAMAIAISLTVPAAYAVDKLTTEKEKVSYMVGMDLANGIGQIKNEVDLEIVIQGLKSAVAGQKTLLTQEEAMKVRQEFMQKLQAKQQEEQKVISEKNKGEGEKFLQENKKKPGVKVTASGLQYQVVTQGKGKKPGATDQVKVHYTGTLIDGTKFDSSVDRGQPAQFALNGVIPGWTEALQLMNAGSKYKLFIPANLAYGDRGTPGGPIGPNAALVFDVELLEVLSDSNAGKPEQKPAAEVK